MKNLHIENLRGIKSLDLQDFQQVNYITGNHKTTVLEALLIAANPIDLKWFLQVCHIRGVRPDFKYAEAKDALVPLFHDFDISAPIVINDYQIALDDNETVTRLDEMRIDVPIFSGSKTSQFVVIKNDEGGEWRGVVDIENGRWVTRIQRMLAYVKAIYVNPSVKMDLPELFSIVAREGNKQVLLDALGIEDVQILTGYNLELHIKTDYGFLPMQSLGTKMQMLIKTLIAIATHDVVLVDDVSVYSYAELEIIEAFAAKFPCQLFMATDALFTGKHSYRI